MRILYWTELFWPYIGGVEVRSSKLLPALQQRGHEFTVVTSQGSLDLPDEAEYKGTPVYRFPFLTALATGDVDQVMETLQKVARVKQIFEPDIVHINFTDPSVFFHLHTAYVHPAPCLFGIHYSLSNLTGGQGDTLLERALRSADWVTACSEAGLADARRLVPEIALYSSVIYNGLELPDLPPEPLPMSPPRLLCVGRVVADKGFDLALDALASLQGRFPQVRLVIAGDGPARPELEQQVAELGLTDVTDFVGWVAPDEIPSLINTATLVVVPSRHEAYGLAALEAALMARPVVATGVGGLQEVVVHRQTGLLVEQEDSSALAEAITFLLDRPETTIQMGQAARQRAQEVFGWERYVNAYDALYKRLIKGHSHKRD